MNRFHICPWQADCNLNRNNNVTYVIEKDPLDEKIQKYKEELMLLKLETNKNLRISEEYNKKINQLKNCNNNIDILNSLCKSFNLNKLDDLIDLNEHIKQIQVKDEFVNKIKNTYSNIYNISNTNVADKDIYKWLLNILDDIQVKLNEEQCGLSIYEQICAEVLSFTKCYNLEQAKKLILQIANK